MSLATIVKKIEDEAHAQSQALIDKAKEDAEQIRKHGQEEAEAEADRIIKHAEEDARNLKNRKMATTLLHLRKEKLDNRQKILETVFQKALEQIRAIGGEEYKSILRNILLSVEEERHGNISFAEADKDIVDAEFIDEVNATLEKKKRKLQFKLLKKTADIEKGFVVDFRDFEINYSAEKILEGLWEEIKGNVSRQLFEPGK